MPQNDIYSPVDLPEGLRRQFERVERRLWRVESATAACGIAASLLFSLLAAFISDRLWETPVWLRVLFFMGGLAGALCDHAGLGAALGLAAARPAGAGHAGAKKIPPAG